MKQFTTKLGKLFTAAFFFWRTLNFGSATRLQKLLISICLLLSLTVLFAAFWPRGKVYTLNAVTEIVSIIIADPLYSEWNLAGASLNRDPFENTWTSEPLSDFSVLIMNPGVSVEIQRHGVEELFVKLECTGGSIGAIQEENGAKIELDEWALLKFEPQDMPLLLPYRGYLSLGEDVARHVNSILLAGTVSIVEQKLFGRGHYTAGEESLDTGDRVQLWQPSPEGTPETSLGNSLCGGVAQTLHSRQREGYTASRLDGFLRVEPAAFSEAANAMQLVAHGDAEFARVERFGSGGYEIKVQPFHRFINDPILAALIGFLGLSVMFIELFSKIIDTGKKPENTGPE